MGNAPSRCMAGMLNYLEDMEKKFSESTLSYSSITAMFLRV